MDAKEFKKFCKEEFTKRGFRKVKSCYYRQEEGLLCALYLQHSDFGPEYYINYYFFLGDFSDKEYPTRYDHDFHGRFAVMSKTMTVEGKTFLTGQIEHNFYTEDELRPYIEKNFEELIYPVLEQGKKAIILLLEQKECHANILREEETLAKLYD